MSPRAACRLETLGFAEVYDYVAGKADWLGRGLPREGEKAREPRAFDLVAVLYLQLPRPELARAVRAAAAAVAAGGTLFVLGHDTTNLTDGHGGPKDAAVLYTAEDVVAELGDLVVERAEAVERVVALDAGDAVAIDALVRAHRPA